MNKLKRTLALVATLAMATTAFASCDNGKESSKAESSKAESSAAESSDAESSDAESSDDDSTADPSAKSEEVGAIDSSLKTGGDTFTVSSWNADDAEALIKQWEKATGKKATFNNMSCKGGEAAEKYNNMFQAGDDIDVFFVEADWALQFVNDDTKTVALDKLGFTDANFAEMYAYTDEIGKDLNGVRKGASWQAAAGGFAYRTDLAEKYLDVKTPEEMQAKIGTWDGFVDAAQTVADATNGKTALCDTLGGLWQVFAAGRTSAWVQNNTLVVDDSCKEFADLAKKLWDMGGVTKYDQWEKEWLPMGQTDEVMGYFVSTWGFGETILVGAAGGEDGATYGKWNVCVGPQEYFWGGTWMVVSPKTNNAEECQSFIKTFTVDDAQIKEYALSKPEYCNNTTVMAEIIKEAAADTSVYKDTLVLNNLNGQNYFEVLDESVKGVDLNGLITPYDATIKAKFVKIVKDDYVKGGKSWDDTLTAFKKAVKGEIDSLNVE